MRLATKVYDAFKDDKEKAQILSEVIDEIESRLSPLSDVARRGDLEIVKLTLEKEIEQVRLQLQKEIEQVRLQLQKEIEKLRASVIKWVTGLLIVQTGVIVSILVALLR